MFPIRSGTVTCDADPSYSVAHWWNKSTIQPVSQIQGLNSVCVTKCCVLARMSAVERAWLFTESLMKGILMENTEFNSLTFLLWCGKLENIYLTYNLIAECHLQMNSHLGLSWLCILLVYLGSCHIDMFYSFSQSQITGYFIFSIITGTATDATTFIHKNSEWCLSVKCHKCNACSAWLLGCCYVVAKVLRVLFSIGYCCAVSSGLLSRCKGVLNCY